MPELTPSYATEAGSEDDSEIFLGEDHDGTYGMNLKYDGGDNKLYIGGESSGTSYGPHIAITRNDGDVGIGTSSPTTKLHIYESTDATPSSSSDGAFRIQGSSTSLTIGQNTTYNWIQTWSSQPLAINPLGNNVGIGTSSPSAKLDIHGSGALIQMENTTSNHQWEWYTSGSVGDDGIGLYDRTNSSYRLAINDDGNVGIGTTSPTEKLDVEGNARIDNGYLNVGGTSTSTTRYGVKEIYRDASWVIEDEYQAVRMYEDPSGGDALLTRPAGATSFTIYRVEYDVNALTTDADEEQWFQLQVGGNTCDDQAGTLSSWGTHCGNGTKIGKTSPMADYGWIGDDNSAFNINETVETNTTFTGSSYYLFLYGADENAGAGQVETSSIRVKIYYKYTVAAQNGDIVAGGRVYANSTKSVGDVAEHFPVNDGVEVGHIISTEPGKSNFYKLADKSYCNHLVGVISNEPSLVLNDPNEGPPVGLTGRVIVKLINSDRLILSGDFITSSNQKGLGQLASYEGPVIGYAVRDQKAGEDYVEILLQPGRYYKPDKSNELHKLEDRIIELENFIFQQSKK